MNLWFSAPVLFAVLVLTSSAPIDDKCKDVNDLQLPEVQAKMTGKIHFLMGYTDNHVFKAILNTTDSSWVRISKIPDDPKTFNLFESNKIGGKCFTSNLTLTFDGHKTSASVNNFTTEFHLLPSCTGCLAMDINSTATNLQHFLNLMQIDVEAGPGEISARSFYLMANRTSLPELDLMRFKDQAKCLGFSGEPDYQHDPEKGFCGEGDGFHITI